MTVDRYTAQTQCMQGGRIKIGITYNHDLFLPSMDFPINTNLQLMEIWFAIIPAIFPTLKDKIS